MTRPVKDAATPPWWQSAVVYQVYPRSFQDSDGDGIGDIPGIRRRLDHLQRLGVDVVWLSPAYRSPQADNGYDISDYQDVDPLFGSLDDLDGLIADLHRRGMKLVMDLVVNHTSDEHPWFVQSRASSASSKRDWYVWRPPRAGHVGGEPGAEPNGWRSYFSGPAWTWDEATGEYYLRLFHTKQPDLNWENPDVREAVWSMMRWWVERGVDGFRMDVVNNISKPIDLTGPEADGFVYGFGPKRHEYLQEMRREVFDRYPDRDLLTVGEMPGVTIEDAVLYTDPARREVDMVFQFEHVGLDHGPGGKFDPVPLDLRALRASLGRWQDGLAAVGWNALYWDNHDQPRAVSRFGDDGEHWRESATALATVLHLHRGTPYVYQGEELGMTNVPYASIDDAQDVESLNAYAEAVAGEAPGGLTPERVLDGIRAMGRDNARTPVQWDGTEHAGFTTGTPWLPVAPNHTWLNAQAQYDDPRSVFHHYRRLIALRHERPVVAHGDLTMLLPDDEYLYAFERTFAGERLVVVANLSGERRRAPLDVGGMRVVLGNTEHHATGTIVGGGVLAGAGLDRPGDDEEPGIDLDPWEAVVLG
ncbi:alpha-glucosidase [Luteimicrobium subarcticum]|uniref:alpha-glucosidase n=1 Tax=Luteimicrobium subarcticum TaxID=620910 RepID=UPI000C248335|nr:alpha-glucosidase [Luteimicrobium subarcticum]